MSMPPTAPTNLASPGDRFIAFLIDAGILIAANIAVGIVTAILAKIHLGFVGYILNLLMFFAAIGYFIYFWGVDNPYTGRGQTFGKKFRGIKIVKEDGSDLTVKDAVMRYIGYIVSSIVIYLGFIWILIDKQNQGWHDKIAKTYVIKI